MYHVIDIVSLFKDESCEAASRCAQQMKDRRARLPLSFVLLHVGVTIDGGLDWMIKFIAPDTFTHFGTRGNTALSLIYKLFSVHEDSQSSLVVSWQRIYHSVTVTSNHTLSLLGTV
jgi:hypothetical protein